MFRWTYLFASMFRFMSDATLLVTPYMLGYVYCLLVEVSLLLT